MSRATSLLGLWAALISGPVLAADPAATPSETPSTVVAPPAWPAPGAPLTVAQVHFPEGFGKHRIYLDAGHGAEGNTGNKSVTCEDEETFTLRVAEDLARRLEATGHFRVLLSRKPGEHVPYPSRINAARKWNAQVMLSLHSDARGTAQPWEPTPGQQCYRQDASPGFSVLWSEEAAAPLRARRELLAHALARSLGHAGFRSYDGADYTGLYAADAAQAGVFVAKVSEPTHRRIFVLRRPTIPSVIIETHHALDFEEAARWREERTLEAFSAAVAQGLVDALAPAPGPSATARP
ncbi:N-acetylmuramoyl-L-alanine amidase [Pyxidicoccus parkwayensis]|uniref:N-acetylmuramoyl-L-alanine amidase n=1 Tax=Pyxidicoccus parkwayensis TaxID=2813578 RepID=A0ABX7P5P0_9BACT|nr:N-acetylmuramoyl-L-alanine amidase [Pyxidicoccus parkwaysis]QSQ25807.1 N-acetylmuramoyl-L-alanine amidase [Pyxidicoccus parkwaysis]